MSEPKAQLVAPKGNFNLPGMNATGVITSTSFSGVGGVVTNLTGSPDLDVGIVTGSSFIGDGTGHAASLTGTPELNLGITTATSFIGDATGKAAGLTGTPNLNVGLVTGTSFVGFVTGNVTGNLTGTVTGLGASVKSGVNLGVGVCTAVELYGDGSTLTGAGSSAYIAQEITATGAETIIDLSDGNVIYYDSSSNTTVGFASTSAAEQITFIRNTSNSYTITWPSTVKWNNNTTPTLLDNSRDAAFQIFHLTTVDTGASYQAWEEMQSDPQTASIYGSGGGSIAAYGFNGALPSGASEVSSPVQLPGGVNYTAWATCEYSMLQVRDGKAWGLRHNGNGELGLNDNTAYSSPMQIGTDTDWKTVSGNERGFHLIKTDGTLWALGKGTYGILGVDQSPSNKNLSSPTQVGGDTNWRSIHGSTDNIIATRTDGTLWAWGQAGGPLGQNQSYSTPTRRSSPTQIGTGEDWGPVISLNVNTAGAVKTDGTLWTWGANEWGELGINEQGPGTDTARSSPIQVPGTWQDVRIAAYGVGLGVKTNGTMWAWGSNIHGSLGQNERTQRSSPTQIGSGTDWNKCSVMNAIPTMLGGSLEYRPFMSAIKTDGTLWSWGYNNNKGQLGLNTVTDAISSPTQIPGTNWLVPMVGGESYNCTFSGGS